MLIAVHEGPRCLPGLRGRPELTVISVERAKEHRVGEQPYLQIEILDPPAIEDLIGKVENVAAQPGAADRVREWRAEHGTERATPLARSFVVVGPTLMFLHPCPDGVVLPFAAYPDGTVKVYTDPEHAGLSFYRDGDPA
ncbi:hypothetical protein GCM10010176_092950 [Nonomuraea spiralis]|nr:hypothetical protein GCM10010176_092950 [Nonomuraea spiralis]